MKRYAVGVIVLGIVIAACASTTHLSSAPSTSSTTTSTTSKRTGTSVVTSTTTSAGPVLTAFGATTAEWNAHHQQDPKTQKGVGFLPRIPDGSDTWNSVLYGDGRVVGYNLEFSPPASEASAVDRVRKELPADAVQGPVRHITDDLGNSCASVDFTSATIASVLADPQLGQTNTIGVLLVSYDSADPTTKVYRRDRVDEAGLSVGPTPTYVRC